MLVRTTVVAQFVLIGANTADSSVSAVEMGVDVAQKRHSPVISSTTPLLGVGHMRSL